MSTKKHKVRQGEDISKIARKYGFCKWETVWNDSSNQTLRDTRKNPHVLFPDDVVSIPDKQTKQVDGSTEQRHKFTSKLPQVKEMLRIKLLGRDREPMANKSYTLTIDGGAAEHLGTTNSEGMLEQEVSVSAKEGLLVIEGYEWPLEFGCLDPVDEQTEDDNVAGAQARLDNLGFFCPQSGVLDNETEAAIRSFQAQQDDLNETGDLDESTCKALRECYGS